MKPQTADFDGMKREIALSGDSSEWWPGPLRRGPVALFHEGPVIALVAGAIPDDSPGVETWGPHTQLQASREEAPASAAPENTWDGVTNPRGEPSCDQHRSSAAGASCVLRKLLNLWDVLCSKETGSSQTLPSE